MPSKIHFILRNYAGNKYYTPNKKLPACLMKLDIYPANKVIMKIPPANNFSNQIIIRTVFPELSEYTRYFSSSTSELEIST